MDTAKSGSRGCFLASRPTFFDVSLVSTVEFYGRGRGGDETIVESQVKVELFM